MRTDARFRLDAIPSADKALHNLGTSNLFALYLFYVGRRHLSAITDLLRLIGRLEEIHTEVQG